MNIDNFQGKKISKQLIINYSSFETRVALIESGQLCEYYIERFLEKGIVNSIFKGRINRVLPGMQCAFVDIGLDRSAFLYVGDIRTPETSGKHLRNLLEEDEFTTDTEFMENGSKSHMRKHQVISDLAHVGQEILVQVSKDAIGTKGARVTTYISLPGRYAVLTPGIDHLGVSKKITSEDERYRLKNILAGVKKPKDIGIIIRTASQGVPEEKIFADVQFLIKLWEVIQQRVSHLPSPALVHEDLSLIFRSTRDLLSNDLDRIVIDDRQKYEELVRFLNRFSQTLAAQVQLYQGENTVFDAYGVEVELEKALGKKVWLKSGGYIIIEQTEALTAIDVNTGRFVGNRSLGETIVRTNMEAVKEIVLQVRLRNIGGIIILDFIDMDKQDDRDRVFNALLEELKKDKAKTSALKISELGLVQMTRKRTEESLMRKMCSPCSICEGTGVVKSAITVTYEIIREVKRIAKFETYESFIIKAHPSVIDRLYEEDHIYLNEACMVSNMKVVLKTLEGFAIDHYEISQLM